VSAISIVSAILAADSAVMAVASSISPIAAPETVTRPALVLHLSRETDEPTLRGAGLYPEAEFVVDALGESFGAANALGDLIKGVLTNWRGTITGAEVSHILPSGIDHFDRGERGDAWRRRLGFRIRYRTA